jgi:ABC-2 type transport system permease protein
MNHVWSITRKELRAYFLSPIAFIFLGTFLFVTLLTFLWVTPFFSRNIADIRPLFLWLPRLLIFLAAAMTMRLWSEEQKLGTMELLFTLPVDKWKLVAGKFLAAEILVAVALALTLHVPIAVSMMGDLDWGPVIGGYVAALFVAAAYIAIGLSISAITDNQIIALILTCLTCGLFYLIGTEELTAYLPQRGAEILEAIGTGSRFESIRRGVIDIRDVVYYGSLTFAFLVLNVLILAAKGWSEGNNTRARRMNATMYAGLVIVNLLALNLWLSGVTAVRVDLTERGEYSISKVTKDLTRNLPEPLLIRGYFSEKTHPILAPMVPRIRDIIEEYGIVSNGKVRTELIDPRADEELEKEANQAYGIKSYPFQIQDRHDMGVVNSYFSILIKYGDQFEVLSFTDLIEVQSSGVGNFEVKLRNPEYDITRAIKKVAYSFQSLEAMFADVKGDVVLTAFVTPSTLPEQFKDVPSRIEKVAKELVAQSGNKLKFEMVDPDATGRRDELATKYGFKPFQASLFSQETFYLHLLLKMGDRLERIMPSQEMAEADVKKEVVAAIQRGAPGFLKTVGILKSIEEAPQHPQIPGRPPPQPQDVSRMFTQQLSESYKTQDIDLKDGRVPGDIDVLLVFGPKNLDDKQKLAIDQYLMRGGTVIVLAGKFELDVQSGESLNVKKNQMGIEDLLASYGVTVEDSMVMDPQNEGFPMPVVRDLGGIKVRDIRMLPYPFFVDVRQTGMDSENPAVAGLNGVTMQWVSPLTVATPPSGDDGKPKREIAELLKSTPRSWIESDHTAVQPDFQKFPEIGFGPSGDAKARTLAVAVKGKFDSFYANKNDVGPVIKESPEDARLIVIGSSSFASDMVLGLSRQTGNDRFMNNLQFLQNLVDWAVEDVDLLSIRSRGTFARTLLPMESSTRTTYEMAMYGVPVLALGILAIVFMGRRRRMVAMELDTNKRRREAPPSTPLTPTTEVRS